MKRTVLVFGLIAGAILSAMILLTIPFIDSIGFDRAEIIGYTSMVLAFLLIFFGVRSYRDNVAGGRIGFGRALAVGTLISLVASLCYVATWQVVHTVVVPDFWPKYQAYSLETARDDGKSEEEIARMKADLDKYGEMYRNPVKVAALTFAEAFPLAFVVALVSAGVLSRRRRDGVLIDRAPSALAGTGPAPLRRES